METTFEHQYLVKSPEMEEDAVLWWMRPKESFDEDVQKRTCPGICTFRQSI